MKRDERGERNEGTAAAFEKAAFVEAAGSFGLSARESVPPEAAGP